MQNITPPLICAVSGSLNIKNQFEWSGIPLIHLCWHKFTNPYKMVRMCLSCWESVSFYCVLVLILPIFTPIDRFKSCTWKNFSHFTLCCWYIFQCFIMHSCLKSFIVLFCCIMAQDWVEAVHIPPSLVHNFLCPFCTMIPVPILAGYR